MVIAQSSDINYGVLGIVLCTDRMEITSGFTVCINEKRNKYFHANLVKKLATKSHCHL